MECFFNRDGCVCSKNRKLKERYIHLYIHEYAAKLISKCVAGI